LRWHWGGGEVSDESAWSDLYIIAVGADMEGRERGAGEKDKPVCETSLGNWAGNWMLEDVGAGK